MAKFHYLPDRKETEREASEWIARLNAEDVSAEDTARFEAWHSAHPHHARAYQELLATWRELQTSGPLVRAVSFGQSMNVASCERALRRRRTFFAVAAGVIAIVVSTGWYLGQLKAETLFETAIGEHATVALPDGSLLDLNSNSVARVDFREHTRIIRLLRGEAFFRVAHDKDRPFWVVADDSWIRAVGTAFNVYLRPVSVEVTVSEGVVKVASDRSKHQIPSDFVMAQSAVSVLMAGEQIDVHNGSASIRSLRPVDLSRSVAWRRGSLYFENQPLSDVVEEINRYTSVQIEVHDELLRRLPIGGTFQANSDGADALLTLLRDGFGLTIRRDGRDRASIEGPPPH